MATPLTEDALNQLLLGTISGENFLNLVERNTIEIPPREILDQLQRGQFLTRAQRVSIDEFVRRQDQETLDIDIRGLPFGGSLGGTFAGTPTNIAADLTLTVDQQRLITDRLAQITEITVSPEDLTVEQILAGTGGAEQIARALTEEALTVEGIGEIEGVIPIITAPTLTPEEVEALPQDRLRTVDHPTLGTITFLTDEFGDIDPSFGILTEDEQRLSRANADRAIQDIRLRGEEFTQRAASQRISDFISILDLRGREEDRTLRREELDLERACRSPQHRCNPESQTCPSPDRVRFP